MSRLPRQVWVMNEKSVYSIVFHLPVPGGKLDNPFDHRAIHGAPV